MRGHIRKRGNSWVIVAYLGRDPQTGKRRYQWQSVKGNKKQAEKELTALLTRLENGIYIKPTKMTVEEYLEQWLQDYVSSNVRPRTREDYTSKVRLHIIPELGRVGLTELQPSHIQAFYRKKLESGRIDGKGGLSARTVLHLHRILSESLEHAMRWGYVGRNVARLVDPPRAIHKEMQTLNADEVHKLLDAFKGTIYYPITYLAIHTGLRRSELLGLRWRDVDLDMATLSVVQVLLTLNGGIVHFQEPKTHKSRRQVSLAPSVALELRKHKEDQQINYMMTGNQLTPDSLVFSHSDGAPILPSAVSHNFVKIARHIGLVGVRFHDLRHTHATLLLKDGIHPKVVQERLGHSNISMTLDTYSHVTPDMQRSAAQALEKVLSRERPFQGAN
ncbi:MAG: site-specific integrase [Chloroflexi bacterium]|nr:site-specific integrase [Chloroflexota bacterium]